MGIEHFAKCVSVLFYAVRIRRLSVYFLNVERR